MELKNNAVWILQGNDCFAALSTKEFSEEEWDDYYNRFVSRFKIEDRLKFNRKKIKKNLENKYLFSYLCAVQKCLKG